MRLNKQIQGSSSRCLEAMSRLRLPLEPIRILLRVATVYEDVACFSTTRRVEGPGANPSMSLSRKYLESPI